MVSGDRADALSGQEVTKRRYPSAARVQLWAAQHRVQDEVESIKSYLGTVASGFQREFERFGASVSERTAKMDEEARNRYMEDCAELAHELTNHFPNFAWQTSFVAVYTLLEYEMLFVARILGRHLDIKLDPDDLKDKGIFAAKKYLEDLCGITFPENARPWQEVIHYNRLRNVIVHSRGNVRRTKREKALRNYVRGKNSLSLDNLGRLETSREFCLEVLENVETLLDALFELARNRVRATSS